MTSLLVRISRISGCHVAQVVAGQQRAESRHHRLMCVRYSSVVMWPLPISSMSGSFQWPGPGEFLAAYLLVEADVRHGLPRVADVAGGAPEIAARPWRPTRRRRSGRIGKG